MLLWRLIERQDWRAHAIRSVLFGALPEWNLGSNILALSTVNSGNHQLPVRWAHELHVKHAVNIRSLGPCGVSRLARKRLGVELRRHPC